jgi:crotonobetainyl-CoA:carnitine CoA-transferase CaiB-like acyl-CoA transferase
MALRTTPARHDLSELRRTLTPVLGPVRSRSYWDGPRRWWPGPLDVEGLALGAAGAVIEAVSALTTEQPPRAQLPEAGLRTTSRLVAAAFNSIGHLRVDGTAPVVWAPMSGFNRTADGWIRTHANYPHHARALLDALGIREADQLAPTLRDIPGREAERSIASAGGVAATVAPPRRTRVEPDAWIEFATAPGPTSPGSGRRVHPVARSGSRPLEGVRVLELTRVLAGPAAGRILGMLGADVLRVDPPHLPELLEAHIDTGFDTRSAIADLRLSSRRAMVRRLAGDADAVLLGYRPDALRHFGLDADSLRADFPHLLVVSVSAWEPHGERAGQRGFDSIVQAASGISQVYGHRSEGTWRPGSLPVQALDYATGLGMAAAAIALLASRSRGAAGTARLSLERTAHILLGGRPSATRAPARGLDVPLRHTLSHYGRIDHVPPPFIHGDQELDYLRAPTAYGASALEWLA